MKRIIMIMIILVLSIISSAYASPCPLPEANTETEIGFAGFDWYSDYNETIEAASNRGINALTAGIRDKFEKETKKTPHWKLLLQSIDVGSEKNCGGYLHYENQIPDVAGYSVYSLDLYMMYNPEVGYTPDYTEKDAVQFYMANYEFKVADTKSCYFDLVEKLKKIYGNNPFTDKTKQDEPYACWINQEGAMVGVCDWGFSVHLLYMAPGAEEKLIAIETKVSKQEIEKAKDDMTGL